MGGAIAGGFAGEGARVFVTGRSTASKRAALFSAVASDENRWAL
ncbi:MAG: hypothetical protein ACRDM7_03715 [Thermoleophilaceae bacterium]